jgi:queuine tRNA-ribosyltransferase
LPPLRFEIVGECSHTGARAGLLYTAHGLIETPVFMPVGTQATVKGLTQRDLAEDLGVKILLANTYHLFLRPGPELIGRFGGLHRFMSWPNAILTDSGGYQVFSLSGLRKITERGVVFQSHLDGALHTFTPESVVDAQLAFRSDILMVLDECPEYPVSHEFAHESMERTLAWARRAFAHYRARLRESGPEGGDPFGPVCPTAGALFPIVQGSMFADLRRRSAAELVTLEADGYAIGGLSVGEPRALSLEMVEAAAGILPRHRPRYAMGVGMPFELAEYVARGVDMMDCVLPSRNARNGCLFTSRGRLIIKHARYKDDPGPVDENCQCYTCKGYSRAYLRHLFLSGELLYAALATRHNVHRYLDIMREIRQAILSGGFHEYLKTVRSASEDAE